MSGKKLYYIPTPEDKAKMDKKCSQVIDLLSDCPIEMKAMILHTLVTSFEDITHMDVRGAIRT